MMLTAKTTSARVRALLISLLREQEGAIAVLVALSLSAILGMVALSFDLSRAYNLQTELGQAADASALAGATQLDNTLGSVRRACQAAGGEATYPCTSTGVTIGDAIVVNQEKFSSEGLAGDVDALQIEFLVSLGTGPGSAGRVYVDQSGPEADADATANFIEVSVVPRTVYFPFAAAIGAVPSTSPTGFAVAGFGEALCQVPPIMICNPADTGNGEPFDANDYRGYGIKLDEGGNGAWTPGTFGLLSVSDPGANGVRDAMGKLNPDSVCFGDELETQPGQLANIRQGMNVRFNIYEGPLGNGEQMLTQYRPARHPAKGMVKLGPSCGFSQSGGPAGWTKPDKPFGFDLDAPDDWPQGKGPSTDPAIQSDIDAMGFPRDDCHYDFDPVLANLGSVGGVCADFRWGDGIWDFNTYMFVNHNGMTQFAYIAAGGECAACDDPSLKPAPNVVTRTEVYEWEIAQDLVPGTLPTFPTPTNEDTWPTGANQCAPYDEFAPPPDDQPDRRIIVAAVVNCETPEHDCDDQGQNCDPVIGKTDGVQPSQPDGKVGILLTEPMGIFDNVNNLYGEIIGPVAGEDFEVVSKFIVQLYE